MRPITTPRRALALAILITIFVSIFLLYRSDEDSNINSIPISEKPEPHAVEEGIPPSRPPTKKIVDAKNLMSVRHCDTTHFNWVSDDIDGLITKFQDDKLILSHITGKVKLVIDTSSIVWNGTILSFNSHRLVLSKKYLLLENNIVKLGHTEGMVSDYYLYNIHEGMVEKLYDRVSIVVDCPTLLAFVSNYDLYIYRDGEITLLTDHGDSLRRHGIPNWIYKEEIFGNNKNIWISKYDNIAWLTFNDANVGTVDIQYYKWSTNKYPFTEKMRYPKAGTINPSVELWVHMNYQTEQVLLPLEDRLLVQVDWLENELLVRTMSRTQDQQELFLINFDSGINIELLRNESVLDGGWYQHVVFVNHSYSH